MRTGHAAELAHFQFLIEAQDDQSCQGCKKGMDDTIEHVLCHCTQQELVDARKEKFRRRVPLTDLVEKPELCMVLANRFKALVINTLDSEE